MGNPLRDLKYLPWRSLAQAAGATLLLTKLLDVGIIWGAGSSPAVRHSVQLAFSAPWGLVTLLSISFGMGVLAVYLLETLFQPGPIYSSTLWALVLCLIVAALLVELLSTLLGWPGVLLNLDQILLIGLVLGVFWKGRCYWRY